MAATKLSRQSVNSIQLFLRTCRGRIARLIGLMILTLSPMSAVPAEPESASEVSFAKQIYPVLRRKCIACHIPGQENGGLLLGANASEYYNNLTQFDATTKCSPPLGSDEQKVKRLDVKVAATDPEKTFYHIKLTTDRCGEPMARKGLLKPEEINTITTWLKQGAKNN